MSLRIFATEQRQFVANRLKTQQSPDLLVLKELILKMAGMDSHDCAWPSLVGGRAFRPFTPFFVRESCTLPTSFFFLSLLCYIKYGGASANG